MKNLWHTIFFGNYFYGLCAVALSIEASLQQNNGTCQLAFYLLLFLCTLAYYNKAYVQLEQDARDDHPRASWYQKHQKNIQIKQMICYALIAFLIIKLYGTYSVHIHALFVSEIILILLFPLVGILYYGVENKQNKRLQLRQIGWLKPFIIGFCWAGVVTIYPALYFQMSHAKHFEMNLNCSLLFFNNFLFISVLSIMFDIKDYANDFNHELKTFVVKYGLRKTVFLIIIPLIVLGLFIFIFYAISQQFVYLKILVNVLPFLFMLFIAASLRERKPILFYLIIIDGLMLFKAICGSFSAFFL